MMLRLQNYPRGLGKGSDAAIVGAWLSFLAPLTESDVPAPCLTNVYVLAVYPQKIKPKRLELHLFPTGLLKRLT